MKKLFLLMLMGFCLSMVTEADITIPYSDNLSTTALWHMNTIRENKYMDDDVSSGRTPVANGILNPNPVGGPTLVARSDPNYSSVPYPGGNWAFGNCLYFDGVNDSMSVANTNLWLDPANLRIEGWVKTNVAANGQMFMDRWGQMNIYIESTKVTALTWNAAAVSASNSVSPVGWDPTVWNHVAVEIIGETQKIYVNGVLEGTFTITGGLRTTTTKTTTYLAQRYNGENKFAGYMDEVRISKATAATTHPGDKAGSPYVDKAGMVNALWHFDVFDESGTDRLMPDDDSANPGRDVNLQCFSSLTGKVPSGASTNGPMLVDPNTELVDPIDPNTNIGYPNNNPAFGKCAKFDDVVFEEGDSFRKAIGALNFDTSNFRFETWLRPDPELLKYIPETGKFYYVLDRWRQFVVRMNQAANTGQITIQALLWDTDSGGNARVNYLTAPLGDPNNIGWVHVAVENFKGAAALYINGFVAASVTLGTEGLYGSPYKTTMFIGCRYTPGEFFWGYMDEMRFSVAKPVDCGVWGYLDGDLDGNCYVDVNDLQLLALDWLDTTDPASPNAQQGTFDNYNAYNIPRAVVTPTINGILSPGEWNDAKVIPIVYPDLVTPPNIGALAYTAPTSPADFSGYYYYKWDNTYLYVGIKVYDDVLLFNAGYPDDHVTLGIDINRSRGTAANASFYQFYRNSVGNTVIEQSSAFDPLEDPNNAVVASSIMTDGLFTLGWSYEAALKWTDFKGYTPTVGDKHGFAVLMCDQDDSLGSSRDTFLVDIPSSVMTNLSNYRTVTLTNSLVCGDFGYLENDLDGNCKVDLSDFEKIASDWLGCTDPVGVGCINLN
jgi:hypothetical protein